MTKQPMQADGGATRPEMADENGELASRRDADQGGLPNTGESGGGAYPNRTPARATTLTGPTSSAVMVGRPGSITTVADSWATSSRPARRTLRPSRR